MKLDTSSVQINPVPFSSQRPVPVVWFTPASPAPRGTPGTCLQVPGGDPARGRGEDTPCRGVVACSWFQLVTAPGCCGEARGVRPPGRGALQPAPGRCPHAGPSRALNPLELPRRCRRRSWPNLRHILELSECQSCHVAARLFGTTMAKTMLLAFTFQRDVGHAQCCLGRGVGGQSSWTVTLPAAPFWSPT